MEQRTKVITGVKGVKPLMPKLQLQQTTNFATFFLIFRKKGMIFHENGLPAYDSHEISCLICYF